MLLNERDEPATAEQIADMFEFDQKQVEFALDCLCRVGWLFQADFEGFSCNPPDSAESAKIAEIRPKRSETKRSETKLNKTKRSDSGGFSKSDSLSARLVFDDALRKALPPKTDSDKVAYRNLSKWLIESGNGHSEKVLKIAADSKGRNPIAVFFSRLDKELGYRPSVVKQKESVL